MKTQIWVQTVIIFVEDTKEYIKNQFDKTFKSMNRFYALYFYNSFKTKSFNKWNRCKEKIQNKINEKEIIHNYVGKLYLNS